MYKRQIIRICSSNQNTGGNKDGNYHNEAGGPREARKECQNSYGATAERVPKKCQNVRTDPVSYTHLAITDEGDCWEGGKIYVKAIPNGGIVHNGERSDVFGFTAKWCE